METILIILAVVIFALIVGLLFLKNKQKTLDTTPIIAPNERTTEPKTDTFAQPTPTASALQKAENLIHTQRYDEATQELKRLLMSNPQNSNAMLKLLQVYGLTNNQQAFNQLYQKIHELNDADAIKQADFYRSLLTDNLAVNAPSNLANNTQTNITQTAQPDDLANNLSFENEDGLSFDDSSLTEQTNQTTQFNQAPQAPIVDDGINFDHELDLNLDDSNNSSLDTLHDDNDTISLDLLDDLSQETKPTQFTQNKTDDDFSLNLDLNLAEDNHLIHHDTNATQTSSSYESSTEDFGLEFGLDDNLGGMSADLDNDIELDGELHLDDLILDESNDLSTSIDLDNNAIGNEFSLDNSKDTNDLGDFDFTASEQPSSKQEISHDISDDLNISNDLLATDDLLSMDDANDLDITHSQDFTSSEDFAFDDLTNDSTITNTQNDHNAEGLVDFDFDLTAKSDDSPTDNAIDTTDATDDFADFALDATNDFALDDAQTILDDELVADDSFLFDNNNNHELVADADDFTFDIDNTLNETDLSNVDEPNHQDFDLNADNTAISDLDIDRQVDEQAIDTQTKDTINDFDDDLAQSATANQLNNDFGFVDTNDNAQVTLDLATRYLNLGEHDSARRLLEEVINSGNATQQQNATALLARL